MLNYSFYILIIYQIHAQVSLVRGKDEKEGIGAMIAKLSDFKTFKKIFDQR